MDKEKVENCDICMMYPKVEDDSRCKGCKAMQDSWVKQAKEAGIPLGEWLIKTTRWYL